MSNYLSVSKLFVRLQILPFVKGQISALRNIFFMKLSCNDEVPLFGA